MAHCELSQHQVIHAIDTLDRIKDAQWILDCVMDILFNNNKKDITARVTYLLCIYQDQLKEELPKLEAILNGNEVNE